MRKISLILALIFVLSCFFVGCSPKNKITDFVKDGEIWTLTRGDMKVTVNSTSGFVTGVANSYDEVSFDAILVDGSISSNVMYGQFGYTSMAGAQTWELPILYPKMKDIPEHIVDNIVATETGFEISLTKDIYHLLYKYTILEDALKLDVVLSSDSEKDQTVNGITFAVQGIKGFDIVNSTFEFPGSTPSGKINFTSTGKYKATVSDYACPVVVVEDKQKTTDVIFVDEVEKWTSGSYYDKNDNPCVAFTAAVEGFLSSTKPMEIGSLYIPMTNPNVGAYKTVQNLWKTLGYKNPEKNELTKDLVALYSSHPFGTMDTNYFNRWTLSEYADKMASIANMGFDAVWLLPVFQHTGDNVYEPIDQGLIDMRYGGIEQAKEFIEKTHGLGMSVLFDFVPHGPRPVYPFAKEHQDWISKDILGENQIEWDCVSFDYNNPEYYKYNVELAEYYAREIGLNGARIDCSMGGLSNWYSPIGLRASAAGLMAGKNVVDALYKGFTNVNPNAIILPENFHPSPAYAEVTDVFYDMPLYRCIYNLNQRNIPVTQYVKELTNYLVAEHATSVEGQLKLRFLGNHDTVTWTFDAARAQKIYGVEKAKAMWMIMSWIDGVMFIYQGDEDPATYKLQGENLEDFFKEVIKDKREILPNTLDIEYIYSNNSIFAFRRFDDNISRIVLVNLSANEASYDLNGANEVLANIGNYDINNGKITLGAYSGVIINEK